MPQEYILPDDIVILSRSDLQGNIVDYNEGFRDASGYSDEELKGKPHRLLRHPDMPKEAFKDFWTTIQAGQAWYGLVKNKRKNGDYYWVQANASPIMEDGRIVGYVSVRYPATRAQIEAATQSYAAIMAGHASMTWTKQKSGTLIPTIVATVLAMSMIGVAAFNVSDFSTPLMLLTLLGLGSIAYLITQLWQFSQPKKHHLAAIDALSNGQFKHHIEGTDPWVFALNKIRTRLAETAARQYDLNKTSLVLSTAMNATSTNLMVADTDFKIISINTTLSSMFQEKSAAFKTTLPAFDADKIIGSNMDMFHKSSVHIRSMIEKLRDPWIGKIEIAQLTFEVIVVPIMSNGHKMGYVVEWRDRTQEVELERQVASIIQASEEGMMHLRLDLTQANGSFLSLGKAINGLLAVLGNFTGNIAHTVGEIAFSRLDTNMDGSYKGAYRSVQNSVNFVVRHLNELLGQVQFTSHEVNNATRQLSDGVTHFSDQTQEQAAAIEQTVSTMAEMLLVVKRNTDNVQHAHGLAQGVHDRVEEGNSVMQQALTAMQLIGESGSKIGEIVSLIDSIAFQTNLLALNAAVEAARAGEHGRGFAVVASEVRSLAQKSAEAAKGIKTLIDASVNQIAHGTQLVQKTSVALTDVRHSVDEMSAVVSQIAEASSEQEKGIGEVNKSILVMDRVAQQSAALVEQTAASATHVADQMHGLDAIVRQFSLSQEGQSIARTGRTLLSDMKQAHLNWLIQLGNVIQGIEKINDLDNVANHHVCGLGRWRNTEGKYLDHLPEMKALDSLHEVFHKTIAQALALANRGDIVAANALMPRIDVLSLEVVHQIELIERAMSTHDAFVVQPSASKTRQRGMAQGLIGNSHASCTHVQ